MWKNDPALIFKGFKFKANAMAAWNDASKTRVIEALREGAGKAHWVVIEGVAPAVYSSSYVSLP